MLVRFFNIQWDTDGEDVNLPDDTQMIVDNDINLDLEGADQLSDKFGYCVNSFEFEVLDFAHA